MELSEKEALKKISDSIIPENFLGQGTEAEVYRIQGTDYCVRLPYLAQDRYKLKYSKELTPVDKINHIVAKLGCGATIMKYFEGVIPKWYMNNNHERYKLQEKISEMPVESYSDLLHQIAEATDNEMLFDFSPGNLIVDTKNKKFTAIDFYSITENPKPIKPLCEMYSVLTCYGSLKKTGKTIFDKIVDAGLEEFKPDKIPCIDLELFDFVDLASNRNSDSNYYRQANVSDNMNEFNHIKYYIYNSLKTLKNIKKKEIIDKTLSPTLMNEITEFKKLMAKIH